MEVKLLFYEIILLIFVFRQILIETCVLIDRKGTIIQYFSQSLPRCDTTKKHFPQKYYLILYSGGDCTLKKLLKRYQRKFCDLPLF